MKLIIGVFLLAVQVAIGADAESPEVIRLWANGAPGFELRKDLPESAASYWVKDINNPSLTVFLPPKEKVLTKMEELIHQFILVTEGIQAPVGEVYFGAENPKGELGFYINSKGGGVPYRLKIRAPSFVNLSILGKLLPGHMMSDVVAILGSLDFVMGECDR